MLKIHFVVEGLQRLQGLPLGVRVDALGAAAGRVRAAVEEHFDGLPSRRFWREAADDVVVTALPTERRGGGEMVRARVEIRKRGVALRYYGGTVRPRGNISEMTGKPTKSLFLPGREMRADGGDLFDFVRDPQRVHVAKLPGCVLLVEDMGKGNQPRVLGKLVKSTTHRPNKNVLPTGETMKAAAKKGAAQILSRAKLQKEK